jgi:hypothetical protein
MALRFVVSDLVGRREQWSVRVGAPIAGIGEPAYPAVCATCGGESQRPVHARGAARDGGAP